MRTKTDQERYLKKRLLTEKIKIERIIKMHDNKCEREGWREEKGT